MKNLASILAITLIGSGFSMSANASYIAPSPYPNPGYVNPTTYTFTASTTGDIVAYWADSTNASYTDTLGLLVNGVDTGIAGLNNKTSKIGDSLDFGHVNAGDTLTFVLNVQDTGNTWYSDASRNSDGINHIYSSPFAGSSPVPQGTYVAFEDEAYGSSDLNYHDENFVFTNVSVSSVPLPAAAWLFGSGLIGLVGVARRKG